MKFKNYKKETEDPIPDNDIMDVENMVNYEEEDSLEEEFDDGYYDEETDTYYSREDIEREQRYLERVQAGENLKAKLKNPFGISGKMDGLDERIQYGSSKTKVLFILGMVLILTVMIILFTKVL